MAVIPFPSANARLLYRSGASASWRRSLATVRRLDIDELDALTHADFFPDVGVDAENGTLVMGEEERARLAQYLEFHGLRLPQAVSASLVLELCNNLRWSFGPAVRVAARGDEDIATRFPGLNADKLDYVRAVASQQRETARDVARQVFRGRNDFIFLY